MRYKLARNRVVATLSGHAIEFKKNELTYVPPEAEAEVIAVGAVPETELDENEKTEKPLTAQERKDLILVAIDDMVKRNDSAEFTAGGQPHTTVLSDKLGFKVDAGERDALWKEYRQPKD